MPVVVELNNSDSEDITPMSGDNSNHQQEIMAGDHSIMTGNAMTGGPRVVRKFSENQRVLSLYTIALTMVVLGLLNGRHFAATATNINPPVLDTDIEAGRVHARRPRMCNRKFCRAGTRTVGTYVNFMPVEDEVKNDEDDGWDEDNCCMDKCCFWKTIFVIVLVVALVIAGISVYKLGDSTKTMVN